MEFCQGIEKMNSSQGSAEGIRTKLLLMAGTVEEDLQFILSGKLYWVLVFVK